MTDGDLLMRLRHLAACRRALAEAKAQHDAALAEWQAANTAIIAQVRTCKADAEQADVEARALALVLYQRMDTKQPGPGVMIRMVSRLEYDEKVALGWAEKHGLALALDRKAFERIALSTRPDFVTFWLDPQVTIATDLDKALNEG